MKFNNRDNKLVEAKDGRKVWDSRSCAVTSVVIMRVGKWYQRKKYFLLTILRGKDTPDFQGYKCCPCGYLDWDEPLNWAAVRETEEETTFNPISAWSSRTNPIDSNDENSKRVKIELVYEKYKEGQPFYLSSEPSENRQNVTACFGVVFSVSKEEDLPIISGENVNTLEFEEVASADWIPLEEVKSKKHKFAFNHENRSMDFFRIYKSENKFLNKLLNGFKS
jgi:ADP-ribose pyrophosphatase YjhB (NUDIX family)